MSTLLAIALTAVATTTQADCSWDRPGANPYTGTTDAAIDRYSDIPVKVRDKLKRRMTYGNPDETVQITRDAITGKYTYGAAIRDMHFGASKVCHTVTRANWSATRAEPAAVYCADSHCILVPQICGNVSRITRETQAGAGKPGQELAPPTAARGAASDPLYDWGPHIGEKELGLADAPSYDMSELGESLRQGAMPDPQGDGAWSVQPWPEFPLAALDWPGGEFDRLRGRNLPPAPGGGGNGGGDNPGQPITPGEQPVTAVPEPETWAMLLGGLGLTGWMARRKQRVVARKKAGGEDR